MAPQKKSFFACNAFLCRVKDEYRCDIWLWNDWAKPVYTPAKDGCPKPSEYDASLSLSVDLAATPSKDWDHASVDDYAYPTDAAVTRGMTTLGPHWPNSERRAGTGHGADAGIYLETALWRGAREEDVVRCDGTKAKRMPEWPPGESTQPYRYECLVYKDDDGKLRRYFGFHAILRTIPDVQNRAFFTVFSANDSALTSGKSAEVWIKNLDQCDEIDWARWSNGKNIDSQGPLYLRVEFAGSVVGVNSPKLPKGLGSSAPLKEEPISVAQRVDQYFDGKGRITKRWHDTAHVVSLSHDRPDDELRAIHHLMHDKSEITHERWGAETFIRILSKIAHSPGDQILDLIGHSTAYSLFLDFGGWVIQPDQELEAFCARVSGHVARFKEIRLIGCATAGSTEGRTAMTILQDSLGIKVLGTSGIVYAANFDPQGYYDGSSVVSADTEKTQSILSMPDNARIRHIPQIDALYYPQILPPQSRYERIFSPLDVPEFLATYIDSTRAWFLPGLLTKPLVEIVVGKSDGKRLLGDILFNWNFLRVKLANGHVVFLIADPIGIRDHFMSFQPNAPHIRTALRLA